MQASEGLRHRNLDLEVREDVRGVYIDQSSRS
jgi:hypothetical protein